MARGAAEEPDLEGDERALQAESGNGPAAAIAAGDDGDDGGAGRRDEGHGSPCLLYTSDAADERSSVDLGGRRIIKKKNIERMDDDHHLSHIELTQNNMEQPT